MRMRLQTGSNGNPISIIRQQCFNQLFPKLCDNHPVNNDYWILHTAGCNVTLHSVTSELQQVISLENCQTIYKCWLIFDNTSVCLYLSSEDNQDQPAKRLYLYVLYVQQGKWTKSIYSLQHIFAAPFHRVGTISSSVALYEVTNEEKGKTAQFFIGDGRKLWRLTLLLDSLSSPELKHLKICKRGHQVVQISKAGTNNMMIFCDNQIILINLELRQFVDITPPEFKNVSLYSAKSFLSKSGETAFLTVKSQGGTTNCLIFVDIQNLSSYCQVVLNNNTVTDGIFIDEQFFGILNHTTVVVMNTTIPVYGATIANVCPMSNCYLYQTEKLLYIYGRHITTVLDKEAYNTVTIQNASIYRVLPIVEKAYHNCNKLMPLPTRIVPTSVKIPISSTGLVNDSPSFIPGSRFTAVASSATISIFKSTFLSNTFYMTTTPITVSSIVTQVATANVQESPSPTTNSVADEVDVRITISIVILVVIMILLLLTLSVMICCCHRNGKDKYSLSSKMYNLPLQLPPVCFSTHYFIPASQERRPAAQAMHAYS